jgi:hypothetical protein
VRVHLAQQWFPFPMALVLVDFDVVLGDVGHGAGARNSG